MKFLILLLIPLSSYASYVSLFEADVFIKNGEYTSYSQKDFCESENKTECLDVSSINPYFAELIDNEVLDYVSQKQYESCLDEADCDDKFSRIVCTEGEEIKNYETLAVYCAVNVMRIEGKKLVESPSKKAAYEAKILAEKQAKELQISNKAALKLAIKEDIKTATTVAKLKALIEKMIEVNE